MHALDALRGFCAIGVAVYHYRLWSALAVPAPVEGLLAFLGTYGVSIFFILSGYSLAHAYQRRFDGALSGEHVLSYLRRRLARLGPLFAVTVLLSIAGKIATGGDVPDPFTALASILLIFGFVDPANTPVIGGWSIGVEVVFYAFFPFMMLLRRFAFAFLALSLFLTAWVSWRLASLPDLPAGWHWYVHPANQMIFFAGGVFMRLHADRWCAWKQGTWLALLGCVLVVAVLVATGVSELELVTGWRRVLLVSGALLIVAALGAIGTPRSLAKTAEVLGGLSYPLYLLHPLLYFLSSRFIPVSVPSILLLAALAIVGAIFVDRFVDMPLQRRLKGASW
ncbi:acyltransferase family protein [Sphingomonas gei]|uniref:acyltransferase family protein n=1 Tax=Sphingomonas gei TaxID=1395960 RepID=UPI001441145A|nr:acyltransferase [Sphingomonas gei]